MATWLAVASLAACGGGNDSAAAVEDSPAPVSSGGSGTSTPGSTSPGQSYLPAVNLDRATARASGFNTERWAYTNELPGGSDQGAFRTSCDYSHMAADDPIVFPAQPGRSHLHTFFGNTGANAYSTPQSLRSSGNTTCRGGLLNRSAYWVPTMIDTRDGTPLRADSVGVYYKTGYQLQPSQITVPPEGLRMIAGNSSSSGGQSMAYFICHNAPDGNDRRATSIPNCPAGSELWQILIFPQCWDGANLDSPDHKSHMAYPSNGACPSTHARAIPEITFNVVYKVTEANSTPRWRLSSDNYPTTQPGGFSSHGDWMNGWNSETINTFVTNCDRSRRDCHSHLLGDGRTIY